MTAMANTIRYRTARRFMAGTAALALAACSNGFDWDLRLPENAPSTRAAALQADGARPDPDDRGVITYPNYQVALARRGDTVADMASRLGLDAQELASHNALRPDTDLRRGEVLALPRRVDPGDATRREPTDIGTIATSAIDRAETGRTEARAPAEDAEPLRHRVERGETAFSVARLYDVSPRALAEWNGLDSDMTVREGQILMIPVAAEDARSRAPADAPSQPGTGSPTPEPPSAARPIDAADEDAEIPASPDLARARDAQPEPQTPSGEAEPEPAPQPQPDPEPEPEPEPEPRVSEAGFVMPVSGRIIRDFAPGRNEGIGIAAEAGTPVRASAAGTVAAITRDTDEVPIMILRHPDDLLSVYANVADVAVERGDSVARGEVIAVVREADTPFLHFEIRRGFESVDPMSYLD